MILASNLAMALLRAGRVAEADAVVGLTDDRPPDPSRWPLDSMKALVDTRRGALDAAVVRSRVAVDVGPEDEIDLETLCMAAEVDFWRGEAHVTMPRLLRELEVVVDSAPIRIVLPALVTAARGAAEAAGPDPGAGRTVADVRDLVRRAYARLGTVDEVSPQVRAHLVTAHAELARATGQDRADPWSEAAALWDELGRPHDAAYCRWRGAQAALRDGQWHGRRAVARSELSRGARARAARAGRRSDPGRGALNADGSLLRGAGIHPGVHGQGQGPDAPRRRPVPPLSGRGTPRSPSGWSSRCRQGWACGRGPWPCRTRRRSRSG